MEYLLKHGNSNDLIYQQAIKNGEELPDFIKNKPHLIDESLHFYLQAFFTLESERQIGFNVSPIPITKIIAYAKYLNYSSNDDMRFFVNIIRVLDSVALKHYNSQSK